jgi:symplekin
MATTEKKSVAEQLAVLGHARKAVLTEPSYWSSVVPSILPITTPNNAVEVRRWGADFIAEAAATPAVPNRVKEDVCLKILTTLRILIEEDNLDEMITRSVILAAASVYPFVVRWM